MYKQHGTCFSHLPRKVSDRHLKLIDDLMTWNPERTALDLQRILGDLTALALSVSHIKKLRRNLGWTLENTHYCQMIRDVNKTKRLVWCEEMIANRETFHDCIWTDESSVHLENALSRTFRKKGNPRVMRPKPKYGK